MPPAAGLKPHSCRRSAGAKTTEQEVRIHHFRACHFHAGEKAFAVYELT